MKKNNEEFLNKIIPMDIVFIQILRFEKKLRPKRITNCKKSTELRKISIRFSSRCATSRSCFPVRRDEFVRFLLRNKNSVYESEELTLLGLSNTLRNHEAIREHAECAEFYAFPWRLRRVYITIAMGSFATGTSQERTAGTQPRRNCSHFVEFATFLSFYSIPIPDFHECSDDQVISIYIYIYIYLNEICVGSRKLQPPRDF